MGDSTVSRVEFLPTERDRELFVELCELGDREGGEAVLRRLAATPLFWRVISMFNLIREGQL